MNRGVTLLKELQSSVSLLIEEADISFDDLKCNSRFLIHLFDKIPDYRSRCLVDYSLSSLLVISLVLIMKGEFKSFHYASHYVEVYKGDFAKMGLIKDGKVPSHDTFRRMFMLVDAREIKKAIVNNLDKLLKAILDNYNLGRGKELVSIDGKEFRGSGRSISSSTPLRNRNVLNVYNASKEICMFSSPLDDKESEIKEAQGILNKFNLRNVIVTGDALHCQRETCRIVREKKGDYVFTVKENQNCLLEEIKARFTQAKRLVNIEYNDCEYQILKLSPSYMGLEFSGQRCYVKMVSNKRKGQQAGSQQLRHFITSLKDERLIVEAIDNRWKIENDLHRTKDEIFAEDGYSFTDKNAIKVMAVLNNIAYSFFRITASFLREKEPIITKIKFKKDPIEILGKISPLISKKEFSKLISNNLRGKKAK